MNREYAKEIFVHYFKTVYERVGLGWYRQNNIEIEQAIDSILNDEEEEAENDT